VTGWALIACGLFLSGRVDRNATGALLTVTGFAWFLGNFSSAAGIVGWIGTQSVFLHRGPLFHSIVAYPNGRASSKLALVTIAGSYVVALLPAIWDNEAAAIALSALFVGATAWGYVRAVGPDRRAKLVAVEAVAGMGVVISAGAVARLVASSGDVGTVVLLAYEVVLIAVGVGLTAGLVSASDRAAVTDLVVELGGARSGTLRGELARALGDPSLEVAYFQPETREYLDAEGHVVTLPAPGSDRAVTVVEGEHGPVAALVHDPAVLGDPTLLDAVTAASRLAISNARLRAEVQVRVSELEASRRRLLEARDEQRRTLERRLHDGAERTLREIDDVLRGGIDSSDGGGTAERIAAAQVQLDETVEDLRRLARGLHPGALAEGGLGPALDGLRETFILPLGIEVPSDRLDPDVELVAYFVCSEALTNVAKHASASRANVSVTMSGRSMAVVVEDDGVGGADLGRGSGLRGLADRVETLGGTLRVESVPRGGLIATVSRSSSRSSMSRGGCRQPPWAGRAPS